MINIRHFASSIAAISMLSACATKPKNIEAAYVSPLAYEAYSCDQLSLEAQRVSARAAEATGVQKKKAQGDAVAVGVGLIIFWPALFFIKGNGAKEAELARLKGEMEAVEKVSIQKNCGLQFRAEQNTAASVPSEDPEVIPAPDTTAS